MTKEWHMSRSVSACSVVELLVCAAGVASVQAGHRAVTLAVIMTNDPMSNQIKVYDAGTRVLLQTLSTRGKGGVGGTPEASDTNDQPVDRHGEQHICGQPGGRQHCDRRRAVGY